MAHQEMKSNKNLPVESGERAIRFWFYRAAASEEVKDLVCTIDTDVVGTTVGGIDVSIRIVGFLDAGVHFRAVEEAAESI